MMTSSFFLDVFRNRLRKEPQPEKPLLWRDQQCPHGEPWNGLDCHECWIDEQIVERRRHAVVLAVAIAAAIGMVGLLIWLPGIP